MDLKCALTTRLNKAGKPYECIVIKLTDTYEKLVFLEEAEKELVKLSNVKVDNNTTINPFNV